MTSHREDRGTAGERAARSRVLLDRARAGDAEARETLLRWYQPFVLRVAVAVSRRYLSPGRDDEFSVGLSAFNEAIDGYDAGRGVSFLGFAETVIRRRLIDYYRRNRAARREIPLSAVYSSEAEEAESGLRHATEAFQAAAEAWERREEIRRFRSLLAEFGIGLGELARVCPRHEDTRRRVFAVARMLADDPVLADRLRLRRELPLKELAARSGLSRKTLERHRRYIVAVALILLEDLPYLRGYLSRE